MYAEVMLTCGRMCLKVGEFILAMEGDVCRTMLPEEVLDPIPADEMASATIGGEPITEMPMELVRFFRRDYWTPKMLEYVAAKLNSSATLGSARRTDGKIV